LTWTHYRHLIYIDRSDGADLAELFILQIGSA